MVQDYLQFVLQKEKGQLNKINVIIYENADTKKNRGLNLPIC